LQVFPLGRATGDQPDTRGIETVNGDRRRHSRPEKRPKQGARGTPCRRRPTSPAPAQAWARPRAASRSESGSAGRGEDGRDVFACGQGRPRGRSVISHSANPPRPEDQPVGWRKDRPTRRWRHL